MNEDQTNDVQEVPQVPDTEMKLPETATVKTATSAPEHSPLSGALVAVLILLLVFILAGLYYWFSQLTLQTDPAVDVVETPAIERPTAAENNEPESTTAEAAVETQAALSTSDEIAAIEADLNATDLDNLDAELTAIDAELDAALSEI